jgi:hypothetical protein
MAGEHLHRRGVVKVVNSGVYQQIVVPEEVSPQGRELYPSQQKNLIEGEAAGLHC